ncbi:MAG: glycerophosphodiester phosphodiesterase family protein, partial [Alphaproteobacteria bacterium]
MFGKAAFWYSVASQIRAKLPSLLIYSIGLEILFAAIAAPLASLVLDRLVRRGGDLAVTNFDLAGFALSPAGILFILLAIALAVARIMLQQAGLTLIVAASGDHPYSPARALQQTILAAPRFLTAAAYVTVIVVAVAVPFLAIGGGAFQALLGDRDINWFIIARPSEFWIAAGIGAMLLLGAAAVAFFLLSRWALVVPVCLFEKLDGLSALRQSRSIVKGHELRVAAFAGGWVIAFAAATALIWVALYWSADLILEAIPSVTATVWATAILLGVFAVISTILSVAGFTGFSVIALRLHRELSGLDTAPGPEEARRMRLRPIHLALLLAAVVVTAIVISREMIENLELSRAVQVTAHRGASRAAPENTLAAIRRSVEDGADYAEIDVQLLADDAVVLVHDSDFKRVLGLDLQVAHATYDDIRDLDAGSWFSPDFAAERIATLEQAIGAAGDGLKLNIELKFHGGDALLADRVVEIVRAAEFRDRSVITSLDAAGLRRVRALDPSFQVGMIVTAAVGDIGGLPVDFLSLNASLATPARIRANRAAGLQTHVWTINDPDQMLAMIERGVDNVITDEPAVMRRLLDERAELSDAELILLALGRR